MKIGTPIAALLGILSVVAMSVAGGAKIAAGMENQRPGERVDLRRDALAAPRATPSVVNGPRKRRRPDKLRPKAPRGFRVKLFAEGLVTPRNMAVAGNGDVLVVETARGRISVLRDTDGNGVADQKEQYTSGLRQPYGIAVRRPYLYVADLRGVWRYQYRPGPGATGSSPRQLTADIGRGILRSIRTVAFSMSPSAVGETLAKRQPRGQRFNDSTVVAKIR